jgi:periplasmic mercuric ion binding protein
MKCIARAAAALALAGVGIAAILGSGSPAAAAVQARTAKFTVANMTCATCPISVKKAMSNVAGVHSVKVDFGSKVAIALFDPSKTNAGLIAAASAGIGFPATLIP